MVISFGFECLGSEELGRRFTHLIGEPLDQDGDQEVEEDVVAEGHEGDEVQRGPMTRVLHPGEEHDVPVLLR